MATVEADLWNVVEATDPRLRAIPEEAAEPTLEVLLRDYLRHIEHHLPRAIPNSVSPLPP